MDSLRYNQLKRLHRQFLDAAEKYSYLFFAAAKPIEEQERLPIGQRWPWVPGSSGGYVQGIPPYYWKSLLGKSDRESFPFVECWLKIEERVWHGVYFDGSSRSDIPIEELQTLDKQLQVGIAEFERIATLAAGNLPSVESPHPELDKPLEPKPAHRWLEHVIGSVAPLEREAFLLRLVSGNLFTVSALAIEKLQDSAPPPPADNAGQSDGNGGKPTSEQPAINSGADREAILRQLEPADRKAYLSYHYAESKAGKQLEDQEAYELLKDEGIPADKGNLGELVDYDLPTFGTWSRQLRKARKPLGESKYARRSGRVRGQSIVSGREIEYQKGSQ